MTELFILVSGMSGGGAERVAANLQNELPENISRKFIMIYECTSAYPLSGDSYTLLTNYNDKNKVVKVLLHISGFFRYVKLLKKEKPNVVISIQTLEGIWNLLSSLVTKTIPVVSLHAQPKAILQFGIAERAQWRVVGLLAKAIPKAKIIAVSNGVKDQCHELYGVPYDKIKVLYNPIDTKSINLLSSVIDDDNDLFSPVIPVIITVGRLCFSKAQYHLIRAFAALRHEQQTRLLILGIGNEESYLKALVNDLGIENDVVFLGWQENPYKYMARSTVFVLSSISEALPNVLIEAMASGCPVITANCSSGVREIIGEHNEYGFLADDMTGIRHAANEPLDSGESSLLRLMQMFINDKKLHDEYVIRGKYRADSFSIKQGIRAYAQYIQDVCGDE